MTTNFQLVKTVLDELYAEVKLIHGSGTDAKIIERINYLASAYGQLTNASVPGPNYADATTRFAYVYKYVASHADYVYRLMQRNDVIRECLNKQAPHVTCLGGGPGSELVGVLKFIREEGLVTKKLQIHLCDKEAAWSDSWSEVGTKLDLDLQLSTNFLELDVTEPATWSKQKKYLQSDLFVLSFFVSEVFKFKDSASGFWTKLFSDMPEGSIVLFVDNDSEKFLTYFDALAFSSKMEVIDKGAEEMIPSHDEQKAELGAYMEKFSVQPRMKAKLAWRILRK